MTSTPETSPAEKPADELARRVRGEVLSGALDRAAYAGDASPYCRTPELIVLPIDADDVAAAVAFAAEKGLPVAARGAGSGVAGECLTDGLAIDVSRHMNRVVRVDAGRRMAEVQAGCVLAGLNAAVAAAHLRFGPDPSSGDRATIGGMIANNATGAHSLQYGHTGEHLLWVEAVLSDGCVARFGEDGSVEHVWGPTQLLGDIEREVPRLLEEWSDRIAAHWPAGVRNRAGYGVAGVISGGRVNWPRLLAGSEGTLAVFTAAGLRLVPAPTVRVLVQAGFESLERMCDALPAVLAAGVSTCELTDRRLLQAAADAWPDRIGLLPDAEAVLTITVEGDDADEADARSQRVLESLASAGGLSAEPRCIREPQAVERILDLRRKAVPLLHRARTARKPVPGIEDVAVPPDKLSTYVRGLRRAAGAEGVELVFYGHVGHGQPHVRPYLDLHDEADCRTLRRLAARAFELAWSLGGSVSGEHGCGYLRSGFLARQYGELYELMRQLKRLFDPAGLLNPDKVITDAGEDLMLRSMRGREVSAEPAGSSVLYWAPGELEAELEACTGCAVCRSLEPAQGMCPIFRAKGLESVTPRAKVNLMRKLISRLLDSSGAGNGELRAVADNCFNCKMCLLDCPAGVQVSKLMLELKARAVRRDGLRASERTLAGGEGMSRLGSTFAPVANAVLRLRAARWAMEKLTGIDRRRPMPPFAFGSGVRRLRRKLGRAGPVAEPVDRVVYFADLFASYNDHELAAAVVEVLRHNRVEVVVPRQKSAALPRISYGDVERARDTVRRNIESLLPYVRDGYKVVCSEPSAAVALRKEWPDVMGTPEAEEIAAATWELTGYLLSLREEGRLRDDFQRLDAHLAYHAPCHLKVLGPNQGGPELARSIPGVRVEPLDAGCCGMAGTFGFQKRHFELSLSAGERMLNALGESEAPLGLTECSACAMQMSFATDKPALHPVKLLAAAYGLPAGRSVRSRVQTRI
ncbi:MAG: anaerobic glycerol-3-phosphate dehydrogenase subunit C [Phycisphaerae bacterium]